MDATDQLQRPNRNSPDATLRLLVDTGLHLSGERDLGKLTQVAADAAVKMTRARHGALIYIDMRRMANPRSISALVERHPTLSARPCFLTRREIYSLMNSVRISVFTTIFMTTRQPFGAPPLDSPRSHSFLGRPHLL